MTKSHDPGRRRFLKGAGIAGAGAAIADHLWTEAEAQEKQVGTLVGNVKITLDVNAVPGAGNLLGNLLCQITGLLDNSGSTSQIANLLNQIFNLLG